MALIKSIETIAFRSLTSIFIFTCLILSLSNSQSAYAEMKKVSGNSEQISKLHSGYTTYGQTKVRFVNNLHVYASADSDWNNAMVFSAYFYINPSRQGDDYEGSLAITHLNGDQTFIKYEGSWKWALPREGYKWTSESKGRFTGGTGKFKGIRGTFTSKGKGDGRKDLGSEWQIEYEITSTTN